MSLPPDSLLNHLYWLINTPGIGGLSVAAIVLACLGSAVAVLRWIVAGGRAVYLCLSDFSTPPP
jgi:hypothetical protein